MIDAGQLERLNVIFSEFMEGQRYGNGTGPFAKELNSSKSTIQRMLRGDTAISNKVLTNLSVKFGYSPEWIIKGTGDPKAKRPVDEVTEIKVLRVENQLILAKLDQLRSELDEFKQSVKHADQTGVK